ncbi:Hypothetical predicted protein [Mytilus galloprovincialis]|uniref:C2H2-type domain-containing protein n=1 Tax=Mytilus galloprovincialis TaxID=29158 RepID=A0A8B6D5Q8_MYTGA|nr:Hypothetical predicted protein [Mytilus galloprovincialis]
MYHNRGNISRKCECQQCGATFSKRSLLDELKRILGHQDVFICPVCDKGFYRKSNSESHERIHSSSKFYQFEKFIAIERRANFDRNKKSFTVLDETLEIELIHVRLPSGGIGKRCRYVDLKKTCLQIQKNDGSCCAKDIMTAKARLDGHEQWNSI